MNFPKEEPELHKIVLTVVISVFTARIFLAAHGSLLSDLRSTSGCETLLTTSCSSFLLRLTSSSLEFGCCCFLNLTLTWEIKMER